MKFLIAMLLLVAPQSFAEEATYGEVSLTGLARNYWDYQAQGIYGAMVCNVNGADGYLSVRSCASTNCRINRNLKRLAILQVDTSRRNGRWVYVTTAYRNHTEYGRRLNQTRNLHVQGWAHDGYLCDFLD